MKHILNLIFSAMLLCLSFTAQSQFYAYGNLTSRTATGGINYNITITSFNGGYRPFPESNFETADVAAGQVVWINCVRFPITAVVSTSPLVLSVRDSMASGALSGIDLYGYRIAILQEAWVGTTPVFAFGNIADGNAGAQAGVSPTDGGCIGQFYGTQLRAAITTASGGTTNLSYTAAPTNGVVVSNTGTDATLTAADATNAGLLVPSQFTKLGYTQISQTVNLDSLERDVAALVSLSGRPANASNNLTFTGTIIPDNSNTKAALQALETATQAIAQTVEYSAGNGARVTASGTGITFTRTSSSVWTIAVPSGVELYTVNINSTAGESATAALDIDFVFSGTRPYNQQTDLSDLKAAFPTSVKKTSPAQFPTTTAGNNPNWTVAVPTAGTLRMSTAEFTEVGGGGSQGSYLKFSL